MNGEWQPSPMILGGLGSEEVRKPRAVPRTIDPSVTEKKKRITKAEREKARALELEKLEERHTRALLELQSARSLLSRYRQVHKLLTTLLVSAAVLLALSLTLVMLGAANAWLGVMTGVLLTMSGGAIKNSWYGRHRLNTEDRKNNVVVTIDYIDPALNVSLAEAKYATALRNLTEATS